MGPLVRPCCWEVVPKSLYASNCLVVLAACAFVWTRALRQKKPCTKQRRKINKKTKHKPILITKFNKQIWSKFPPPPKQGTSPKNKEIRNMDMNKKKRKTTEKNKENMEPPRKTRKTHKQQGNDDQGCPTPAWAASLPAASKKKLRGWGVGGRGSGCVCENGTICP